MPAWVVREWIAEHGVDRAEALCQESNVEAPVTLRANTLKTTPKELIAALAKSGIVAEKRTAIPEEVTLEGGYPSLRSALFREGHFLIQDAASMLPPHLLEPQPGDRVLDLCAAPGGKTTHLSQLADGKAQVVALDLNPGRIHLVDENVARWGCARVSAVCGDGKAPPLLPVFDRVLVDAPCTGLGTLRRHPDLKWRVTPESRDQLAREQAALLRSGIRLCKNAGLVVYSVCTTTREETEAVVEAVCKTEAVQPEEGPEWLHRWRTGIGRYQTLPANEGLDGFFLMRLRKAS
jgi:16S rRNA (cytosine967-C5)-methyltransferase